SRLDRRFTIKADTGAEALFGDMVVFGRLAMGEVFEAGVFRDTWQLEWFLLVS
ncbi:MAG: urease accessory protein UreD, partial [Sphaerospermopsis sp. SIO1G2]|nr:urease accessory protein UreD [Sphaerospermopsis sp. SIO1G2]